MREIVTIGSGPEDADRARALASLTAGGETEPRVWYTAGLHPHDASRWSREVETAIRDHLVHGAVALGETGLDYHYENSPRPEQREAFSAQLTVAGELDLPVVVHSRDSEEDTLAILDRSGIASERVVLHCFSSSAGMLAEGVERGYYVSFSGMVTFRRYPAEELVRLVPSDRLLAETDAPYLAPVPNRGKRNEPAFVVETVARLAELRGEPVEETAARTRANARRFYELDLSTSCSE